MCQSEKILASVPRWGPYKFHLRASFEPIMSSLSYNIICCIQLPKQISVSMIPLSQVSMFFFLNCKAWSTCLKNKTNHFKDDFCKDGTEVQNNCVHRVDISKRTFPNRRFSLIFFEEILLLEPLPLLLIFNPLEQKFHTFFRVFQVLLACSKHSRSFKLNIGNDVWNNEFYPVENEAHQTAHGYLLILDQSNYISCVIIIIMTIEPCFLLAHLLKSDTRC